MIENDKKAIRAFFKNCPVSERKLFKYSNCIMPISVGQQLQVHEGEKFAATLDLVNTSFKRCTLLIDDSIQRHTMKIFSLESENSLRAKALLNGDEWLDRNRSIYSSLRIEYNILRWDNWLSHPNYSLQRTLVNELYDENDDYRSAINLAISEYISRVSKRDAVQFNPDSAFKYCLEYLLEECSVMCLWSQENYDFELYPSGRNEAMKATYEHLIKPNHLGKLISVSLYFRKKRFSHFGITSDTMNRKIA